jgi:hypothetical protein
MRKWRIDFGLHSQGTRRRGMVAEFEAGDFGEMEAVIVAANINTLLDVINTMPRAGLEQPIEKSLTVSLTGIDGRLASWEMREPDGGTPNDDSVESLFKWLLGDDVKATFNDGSKA